ncbi:RNA polymerase sigma factor [Sphingopyxis sp. GW247-27LB]|uniref:RNA polymerase sigma factor n=1 Tax=Sphingopyxis sp. GW247-27LB TaxID=2012632 RepID=UPI000BA74E6D|nr:RNA polymerase sigma factor [Sphingopyxis sp. GW247-27LB]PAL24979.1 RNA polymerase subunit sigma-24 [Sphingopyxis sp. GW247-27LB]
MSSDLSQCSDKELAAQARAGRERAYRELLARYKAAVFGLIVRQVGDVDEAMDLTQEAFVAAFAAIDRYDGERSFRIWISRIAINKCRDWARRRKVRAFFARALPIEAAHAVVSDTPLPDREADDRSELARVQAAMARLPQKLREVLVLRGVEEVSQAEAAAMLNVSEKAVETRLYRARIRLKALLAEL